VITFPVAHTILIYYFIENKNYKTKIIHSIFKNTLNYIPTKILTIVILLTGKSKEKYIPRYK